MQNVLVLNILKAEIREEAYKICCTLFCKWLTIIVNTSDCGISAMKPVKHRIQVNSQASARCR